jgi:hypothetical protein
MNIPRSAIPVNQGGIEYKINEGTTSMPRELSSIRGNRDSFEKFATKTTKPTADVPQKYKEKSRYRMYLYYSVQTSKVLQIFIDTFYI